MTATRLKYCLIALYLTLLVYALYVGVTKKATQYAISYSDYIEPYTEEDKELPESERVKVLSEWIITSRAEAVRMRLRERKNKL